MAKESMITDRMMTEFRKNIKDIYKSAMDKKEDISMRAMYMHDFADLREIYEIIEEARYEEASELSDELETGPREAIPSELWRFLHGGKDMENEP